MMEKEFLSPVLVDNSGGTLDIPQWSILKMNGLLSFHVDFDGGMSLE